ncbi:DEAD/DEAH box helicase [Planomicrobium sp. Y74]|uniref:DEAD/DEAH box helicase n=1 Tax=Planomicrobium sp. Y74 TaxID=2478977 RepID=UPI000EF4ABF2|nr:DEAD/DEAH box helicase [Planomicrobium sp. Y74]RLQ93012.1 DEAD/DEAH box helicase [Planomicrobium sp. Y74]
MKEIQDFLVGRIWLRDFTPFSKKAIEKAINKGFIAVQKGITEKLECARCLEKSSEKIIPYNCAKCEGICYYCRHCIRMGRVSSCTDLITWKEPLEISSYSHSFSWNGELTNLQQQASDELDESLRRNRSHLVYAVCGAGKTELLFPPLHKALSEGKRICIAAPRTDVVLELSPRLKAAFPDTAMHTLYGGSVFEEGFAQLIVATTHQLYRFQQAFDLVIVDEADAYPYSYDPALARAVNKSLKENAPIVYVSATPSKKMLKSTASQSKIFRRFHGHPLPVPEYRSLWNYRKSFNTNKIPAKLKEWVEQRLEKNEPFMLFFPAINMIRKAEPLFKLIDSRIGAVHSKDEDRKEKVMQLRRGEIPGILTSSILERGVTIDNVQVGIVGADEAVFEAAALIQMAGRAGRSSAFPNGEVIFFHNGISRQMDEARNLIKFYNREGQR